MMIFRGFVDKCEAEIDRIIDRKLSKLENNYVDLMSYLEKARDLSEEEKQLVVNEFLVKPFEKFPFSANKN
jgi:hypothetical protein